MKDNNKDTEQPNLRSFTEINTYDLMAQFLGPQVNKRPAAQPGGQVEDEGMPLAEDGEKKGILNLSRFRVWNYNKS